jgi:hypothetical protein
MLPEASARIYSVERFPGLTPVLGLSAFSHCRDQRLRATLGEIKALHFYT